MARLPGVSGADAEDAANPVDRQATGVVMVGHAVYHLYQQGFVVILPELYRAFDMSPVAAGLLETVRRASTGTANMAGGFTLDRYPEKRLLTLPLSLILLALGFVVVTAAPGYTVTVIAVGLAMGLGSVWHPAALGLLSQVYPQRRGFVLSTHRAVGNVGDALGPLLVGGLLLLVSWQAILLGALPVVLLFTVVLWAALSRAPAWNVHQRKSATTPRSAAEQFRQLKVVVRNRGLVLLLVTAACTGLGQGGVGIWLGLYLSEAQGMGSAGIGVHVALLTGLGIVAGPFIGSLSDRIGRKPVLVGVLGCKALFAAFMAVTGHGILFSASVALLGAVMFAANALIQTAALDMAHGQQLEGSLIGLLWGFNALFTGASPLLMGVLVASVGYGVIFWFVALVNFAAMIPALLLPSVPRPSEG